MRDILNRPAAWAVLALVLAACVALSCAGCASDAPDAGIETPNDAYQDEPQDDAGGDADGQDASDGSNLLSDDGSPQSAEDDDGQAGGGEDGVESDADGLQDRGQNGGGTNEAPDSDPTTPGTGEDGGSGADDDSWDYNEGPDAGDAAPEGLEPEGTRLAREMGAYFDQNFGVSGVPGMAVAVFDESGVRFEQTLGACDSTHQTFIIGSLSKSFTAVAIMQLVEQEKVNLDAPASLYVPGYAMPSSVTIRSLLNQTSGFGYYDSLADAAVGPTAGLFSYANANYDLLGRVVEAVSGEDYGTYLKEHIFDPLGMTDASAGSTQAQGESVSLFRNYFGFSVADGFVHEDSDDAWGTSPSGYVRASLSDMEKYLQMYLNDGEGILSPASVSMIFHSSVPDPAGDTLYGFGWTTFHWDDGELVCSHDGQVENGVARMCLLPDRSMGVIVLGDASDYFGGNANFFQMCDDVVSISIGGDTWGIDRWALMRGHAPVNTALAVVAASAIYAVASFPRWKRRLGARTVAYRQVWVRLILLHGALPAAYLLFPRSQGIYWRDLATFIPDVALVLAVSAAVLFAMGVVKIVWLFSKAKR